MSQLEIVINFPKFLIFFLGGGGSRSFKVIDVGTTGKLVNSACYDELQVCVSATVLTLVELIEVK